MIYLAQLLNKFGTAQIKYFIELFNDLSYELDEMGWRGCEADLIDEMLQNHFGIEFVDADQLQHFTNYIMAKQGQLEMFCRAICTGIGKEF